MAPHPALESNCVAAITGAASGIGLAAAERFLSFGMRVALADIDEGELREAAQALGERFGSDRVLFEVVDVSVLEQVERFRDSALKRFGSVSVVMNNAATGLGGGAWERYAEWQQVLGVNLWGVINGVHAFVPALLAEGRPGLVINTGSKQGITCPPGNTPYNVSKAGVKVVTEAVAHELRNLPDCRVSAHLLVPGWTHTGINRKASRDRAHLEGRSLPEGAPEAASAKPSGAWSSEQVVDFMLSGIEAGQFYILCPDNEVSAEMDKKRMAWAMGDLIEGRPPLSRWHPDYAAAFKEFAAKG